jgi:protein-S-isoprenylcysteine O-methyltransferase Ste14
VLLRLATLVVFTAGWIAVFRYRSEHVATKLAAASERERWWIPVTTAVISSHVTLAQAVLTLPLVGLTPEPPGAATRMLAGLTVFLAGVAWWFWARSALGPLDRFVDTASPPDRLLVTGPFAVVRHPLALGTLVCALGSAIAAGMVTVWATFAASAVCLGKRCLQDEEVLFAVFGSTYGRYAERKRRLVPFVW